MSQQHFEYIIIGAGFAGAAAAYQLTRRGVRDILVLDQEAIPGFHSSGRNAAMVRQCVPEPELVRLTLDGAEFIRNVPDGFPEPLSFKRNGSLLLGSGAGWAKLQRDAEIGAQTGIDLELWTAQQTKKQVPILERAEFDGALWCGSDGIVDIHALLSGYLKAAVNQGARVAYNHPVHTLRTLNGSEWEVVTARDRFQAKVVVNAAGAWANQLAAKAGAPELPMRPCRRHLFVSGALAWVDKSWPFVWDTTHDIYFRPEADGLLLCACDQEELPPGDPPVNGSVQEMLADKIQRYMPALAEVTVSRSWAGFRTLTADGKFVIGWDKHVANFFWIAGLGGHGMTTSAAVGALAAELLIGGSDKKSAAFTPERFAS